MESSFKFIHVTLAMRRAKAQTAHGDIRWYGPQVQELDDW